jgi:cytochrome c biogenesis protein CcmG/thiol:disulfide interchange protein DsbE
VNAAAESGGNTASPGLGMRYKLLLLQPQRRNNPMKKIFLIFLAAYTITAVAQDKSSARALPNVDVKDLTGTTISSSTFENGGKPIIVDFWATWCKPCIEELNAIHESFADWQKETGVKLITISLDDARTMQRVAPFVKGKGWGYENYIDPNGDFKRAMNVNMPPHTFVLNGNKEIVWQHVGFVEGNEDELYEEVKKVSAPAK